MRHLVQHPALLLISLLLFTSCIKKEAEKELLKLATISTSPITAITSESAKCGGNITDDGGSDISSKGIVWGLTPNVTVDQHMGITDEGTGSGAFTSNLSGLDSGTTYYVKAYAINSVGTAYGDQQNFTTNSTYPPGTVHCDSIPTKVVDVTNPVTGKTWMDRNLGASRAATSSTDAQAYGDLYQWGRGPDGHQCRTSSTTSTLSSTDQPGHNSFITTASSPNDWRNPQNTNLWQGVNGVNNPCPSGYRLPTDTELNDERLSWISNDANGAFASLKLPLAGYRLINSGSLYNVGTNGHYWSSTVSSIYSGYLNFYSSIANMYSYDRAYGGAVRCLKD